jgi:hypothetical protein
MWKISLHGNFSSGTFCVYPIGDGAKRGRASIRRPRGWQRRRNSSRWQIIYFWKIVCTCTDHEEMWAILNRVKSDTSLTGGEKEL